jgi:hypothetical protein
MAEAVSINIDIVTRSTRPRANIVIVVERILLFLRSICFDEMSDLLVESWDEKMVFLYKTTTTLNM